MDDGLVPTEASEALCPQYILDESGSPKVHQIHYNPGTLESPLLQGDADPRNVQHSILIWRPASALHPVLVNTVGSTCAEKEGVGRNIKTGGEDGDEWKGT